MKTISIRFRVGDHVDIIALEPVWVKDPCHTCEGHGQLYAESGAHAGHCTTCGGEGNRKRRDPMKERWTVQHYEARVGLARVTEGELKTLHMEYMVDPTGIGTGTVWKPHQVVPAGEGNREVKKRNSLLEERS